MEADRQAGDGVESNSFFQPHPDADDDDDALCPHAVLVAVAPPLVAVDVAHAGACGR